MRRQLVTAAAAVAGLLVVALVSGPGAPTIEAKTPSGKALYIQYCKACHAPGSENGEYSPLTLIQDQWDRFFDKKLVKTHGELDAPDQPGTKLLDAIDAERQCGRDPGVAGRASRVARYRAKT